MAIEFRLQKLPWRYNLIEKYKITCTRSSYYRNLASHTHFADYAFISPEIMVNNFFVLPDEVSDHLPLFLEFE
ncbi:MAG: hypothetical protein MUF50_05100 [Planctomycetes bacterium]|nr:hypothetical protein [Planctomycetota bacterium]